MRNTSTSECECMISHIEWCRCNILPIHIRPIWINDAQIESCNNKQAEQFLICMCIHTGCRELE